MLLIGGGADDLIFLIHKHDLRSIAILDLLRRQLRVRHQNDLITDADAARRRAVQADHAAAALTGDGIGLKAVAVLNIHDGNLLVFVNAGRIQQIGTPQEVFDQPANLFVAGFIGSPQMNFFDGELEKKDGKYQLKVGEATVVLGGKAQELLTGKGVGERKVTVGIRPEHIAFAAAPGSDTVSSKVDVSEMMGSEVYLHVNAVGRDVVLRIPTTDLPAEHRAGIPYGTEINFAFRPDLIHLFDPETEKNLMY